MAWCSSTPPALQLHDTGALVAALQSGKVAAAGLDHFEGEWLLEGRAAALIANHGLVAVAPRPDKALHDTAPVERSAQIAWGAMALGGTVPIPNEVNKNFAAVYTYLHQHPL